jgi:hypothetical protein
MVHSLIEASRQLVSEPRVNQQRVLWCDSAQWCNGVKTFDLVRPLLSTGGPANDARQTMTLDIGEISLCLSIGHDDRVYGTWR